MGFKIPVPNDPVQKSVKVSGPGARLVIILIGLACIAGAYLSMTQVNRLMTEGLHAQGHVIDIQQQPNKKNRTGGGTQQSYIETDFYTIVRFTDGSGNVIDFHDNASSGVPLHHKGEIVTVVYLPENPSGTAVIDKGAMANQSFSFALAGIGALFILFAAVAHYAEKKKSA